MSASLSSFGTLQADLGQATTQNNLGTCYERGEGVPQDHKKAVSWFQKAADQGFALAQNNLRIYSQNDQGMPSDRKQSTIRTPADLIKFFKKP